MRILHSGAIDIHAGGPALSTWLTVKGLRGQGVDVDIITEPATTEGDKIIDTDAKPIFSRKSKFGTLAYVPGLKKQLRSIGNFDLYHIQGMWMLHGKSVSDHARKTDRPYVVTLRGMLYPQALAHNAIVKRLSLALYQGKILKRASAVQCTCIEEMEHFRNLGFKTPVAVLPNPIETTGVIDRAIPFKPVFRIGYLGRIHPRKRVERLIYAMDQLRGQLPSNTELIIIGGGDKGYTEFLQNETKRLKLNNVLFTGFLSGKEKDETINSLSVLAVPSDYENFGNIVTEALVRGVPVIASTGMPWQELQTHHCGWWIHNSQEEINHAIIECFNLGEEHRRLMGINGRNLIASNYSVDSLGKKMKNLYEWILLGGDKPDFVFI